jgi:type 1 fimbria pilin
MFLKRRLGVLAAVVAALAVGAFVASAVRAFEASASAATIPGQWIVPSSCAVTNPATGCAPYWAIQGSPALVSHRTRLQHRGTPSEYRTVGV